MDAMESEFGDGSALEHDPEKTCLALG